MREEKLKQVVADVFGIELTAIDDDTSIDTVAAWDSLKHINLVLALESEFKVTFTEEETTQILNYPLIKVVLQDHGIQFE